MERKPQARNERAGDWRADVATPDAMAAATDRERLQLVNFIKARLLCAHPRVLADALLAEAGALAAVFSPGTAKEIAVRSATVVFDAANEVHGSMRPDGTSTPEVH
jgi:hypothetical protein